MPSRLGETLPHAQVPCNRAPEATRALYKLAKKITKARVMALKVGGPQPQQRASASFLPAVRRCAGAPWTSLSFLAKL